MGGKLTMLFSKMKSRIKVAETILNSIKSNDNHIFLVSGSKGSGRRYILTRINECLCTEYKLFSVFDDEVFQLNKKQHILKVGTAFNLSCYAGIAVTFAKNDTSKLNYIISNLKGFTKKKPICFIIPNVSSLNSIANDFVTTLIENIDYISKQVNRPVFIILSSNKDYVPEYQVDVQIELIDYDKADLKRYLIEYYHYSSNEEFDEKVNTLYELCGANFHLANAFHKDVFSSALYDIDAILHTKMKEYLNNANLAHLTQSEMQQIIEISALSLKSFNKKIIAKVSEVCENNVEICLKYAKEECFLEQILNEYDFISEEIKRALAAEALQNYRTRLITFYNYITENYEDDYLQRLSYLMQIDKEHVEVKLALAFLSLQRASLLHDIETINKIKNYFAEDSKSQDALISFNNALEFYDKGQYVLSNACIESLLDETPSVVLCAVMLRQKFKNMQLSHASTKDLNLIASQLYGLILQPLKHNLEEPFYDFDEKVLRLSIIYDLAPYYLDDENDRTKFTHLFDLGETIYRKIATSSCKCAYAEFLTNIFYRKAFLYAVPEQSIVYYNKALHFFESHKIYDQAAMTLSGRAGMEIAYGDYEQAIKDCIRAEKLVQQYSLVIPEVEKIKNNLYVAQFLAYEKGEHEYHKISNFALETIHKLNEIIPDTPSALKHVVLTNIASLSLYRRDLFSYKDAKSLLEKSLKCSDVSDISDVNVNDFYRYHFAWFEFYAQALEYKWDKASQIVDALEDFCATLLNNEAKHKARILVARNILASKILPSPDQYCKHFAKDTPQISQDIVIRGLMMSDLQFTSYD